jgi:hypothetical protein
MGNKRLKIRYIKSYDFKTTLATGVYGGVAPNGLINMNFFHERAVLPDSEIVNINDQGVQIGIPEVDKDGDITRELHSGILLDVNTARVVASWLESKIKEFERISNVRHGTKS